MDIIASIRNTKSSMFSKEDNVLCRSMNKTKKPNKMYMFVGLFFIVIIIPHRYL